MSGFFPENYSFVREKMRMKNSWRETCELHVEVQNKSQMSTEYSRLEYYLLLCYTLNLVDKISIMSHQNFHLREYWNGSDIENDSVSKELIHW